MNDEELEALLANERPIDDDGFTANVVAKLPPARKPVPRFAILLGATSLSSAIAFTVAPKTLTALIAGAHHANSIAPLVVLGSILAVLIGAAVQEAVRVTSG
jgi:hypothetical protein